MNREKALRLLMRGLFVLALSVSVVASAFYLGARETRDAYESMWAERGYGGQTTPCNSCWPSSFSPDPWTLTETIIPFAWMSTGALPAAALATRKVVPP